jgi:TetR/AcrR family transcriptional regulator, repressor for uid operon
VIQRSENERSFSWWIIPVNQHQLPAADHRTRILDAARRCFVRSGFHRATMQDVASEAGMSAGNIYRYFASKDAMAQSLCERDRTEIAASFAMLEHAPDPMGAFIAIGERHLVNEPRENAIFALDLWGEAARNPRIAEICGAFDADIRRWCGTFIGALIRSGQADKDLDAEALVELLLSIGDGLLTRKARDPAFDARAHLPHIANIVALACAGAMPSLKTNLKYQA